MKNKEKTGLFSFFQRFGATFMLPISILPIVGLFLGLGAAFTTAEVVENYHLGWLLGSGTVLNNILTICSNIGSIIFSNLPLWFAIAIALGMAKQEKAVAALAAAIAFLTMHETINLCLGIYYNNTSFYLDNNELKNGYSEVLGIGTLEMGVFGGVLVGLLVAFLHNRFYNIKLPNAIAFFGGVRFVPIISMLAAIVLGAISAFVWPYAQKVIDGIGWLVQHTSYFGTFIFGFTERALIPFGLHHVFYMPFWTTELGGVLHDGGETFTGNANIFFHELGKNMDFTQGCTRYLTGEYPIIIFCLPAAAIAMQHSAYKNKKKQSFGLLFSASLTAILTGVTEPIEFSFLFAAPGLYYGVHCVAAGASYAIMDILNVTVGKAFSAGAIDLTFFGILPTVGGHRTNWFFVPIVGIIMAVIYYVIFRVAIKAFDLKTPGREDFDVDVKLYSKKDITNKKDKGNNEISSMILTALGGINNILSVENCATRLRVSVKNVEIVNKNMLKQTGSVGLLEKGNDLQIIYGPIVGNIKSDLVEYMKTDEAKNLVINSPQDNLIQNENKKDEDNIKEKNELNINNITNNEENNNIEKSINENQKYNEKNEIEGYEELEKSMDNEIINNDDLNMEDDYEDVNSKNLELDIHENSITKKAPVTIEQTIFAPISGRVKMFKEDNNYDGIAIYPYTKILKAPFDGKIVYISDNYNVITIDSELGARILMRIGYNTSELNGKYFKSLVNVGNNVIKGQKLISFDIDELKKLKYNLTVNIIIRNLGNMRLEHFDRKIIHGLEPLIKISD